MGEAKRRGSFEQRKAESEAAYQEAKRIEKQRQAEYEASLTPEQREKRKQARQTLTMMAGITAGTFLSR